MLSRGRSHTRSRLAGALAATTLMATAACSSGADPKDLSASRTPFSASSSVTTASSNPSPNTSPSPGALVSSDGRFDFVVPSGWNLTTLPKTVVYLSSATVSHDVAPTIVVTRSSVTPAPSLDDTLSMATMQARQAGATVAAAADRSVGGEKAMSFTATAKEKNVELKRTYVIVAHDKGMYSIVLTGAKDDAAAAESALNALLASWTWTKSGVPASTANGTTPAAVPTTTASPSPSSGSSSASSGTSAPSSASSSATSSAKPSTAASAPSSASPTHTSEPAAQPLPSMTPTGH